MDENAKKKAWNLLGGRSPAQFVQLSAEERRTYYERYLVDKDEIVVNGASDSWRPNQELRRQRFVGDDAAGKQIVQEANDVFYTQNRFHVQSFALDEFLMDEALGNGGHPCNVNKLIRKLIVKVNTKDGRDENGPPKPGDQGKISDFDVDPWAVFDLKSLLAVENPDQIVIEISGGGPANGADLLTQLKIKEISHIVQQLISRFGRKLAVRKSRSKISAASNAFLKKSPQVFDLLPYWTPPTDQTFQNFDRGGASFEELMRVQISEWVLGGENHWFL